MVALEGQSVDINRVLINQAVMSPIKVLETRE